MQTSQFHLFSLPPELVDTLRPRNLFDSEEPVRASEATLEPAAPVSTAASRACNVCQGVTFADVKDQRIHFRSDWHRYNVKSRLNNGKSVSEADFALLVDRLDESLSGSASSTDDDDSDDAVSTLIRRTKKLDSVPEEEEQATKQPPLSALTWFHSPPATQIGIYRAIFPLKLDPEGYLDELRRMQSFAEGGRLWAMFMVAGGHFAGAVVRVSKPDEDDAPDGEPAGRKKKAMKKPKPEVEVLLHKTFHRYTTRRKQGGSQSANDNAKGPAKSAGALLRRYGEQALRDDIRELLSEWSEYIGQSERIWIRASTSNKRIFYDYDDALWSKSDERLRTFPFPTRRPTQSELQRCLNELVRPKISYFTEEELRLQDEAYLASLPKPKPLPTTVAAVEKPKPQKLSKEEEVLRGKWSRLLDMVSKGRLEPLKAFLEKEGPGLGGVNAIIPEWVGERRVTILQISSQSGHEEMTRWLLEDARADPTIPVSSFAADIEAGDDTNNQSGQRTAYTIASSKAIRDIFRRVAGAHPDWWDWFGAAKVPSALTQEREDELEQRKKVRRKGLKDKVRERVSKADGKGDGAASAEDEHAVELTALVNEPVLPNTSTARRLGGTAGSADAVIGLSPEMRLKLERERRARAIEARLKAAGS